MSTSKAARRTKRKAKRTARRSEWLQAHSLPATFRFTLSDAIEAGDETSVELIEAAAGDGEGTLRKFRMSAYTGGLLDLAGYGYPVLVDLSGMRAPRKAIPILRDHDAGSIVGHGRPEINAGSIRVVDGKISGAGEAAQEVGDSADNGFPWEASIGAKAQKLAYVDTGEKVTANGRTFTGPLYVARQSQLKEVSFVAIGADRGGASARLVASTQTQGSDDMTFTQWLQAKGFTEADLTDSTRTSLQAMFDAEIAGAGGDGATLPAGDADDDITGGGTQNDVLDVATIRATHRQVASEEAQREAAIRAIAVSEGVSGMIRVDDAGRLTATGGREVDFVAHALANWDATTTELMAMRAARPASTGQRPGGNGGNHDQGVIEAALCFSAGLPDDIVAQGLTEQQVDRATAREFQGYSLHALMDMAIELSGSHFRGNRKSDAFIRASLAAERSIQASGFTSLSLSGLLGNVANKSILSAYEDVETVWDQVAAVRNHNSFKVHTHYRMSADRSFKKVGPDGELKHIGLTETSHTNQLDTYGAMINLTRQMQIDDDLGAFLRIPTELGSMAATRIEEAVFELLLSNPSSFFHADNGNLLTGAGSALSIASLTLAENEFRNQTVNGKPILVSPDRILTGVGLHVTAKELHDETKVNETTTADTRSPNRNPHAGKYKPIATPYLNNTAITNQDDDAISGQSDTLWYLMSNPARMAAIGVAFLNGRRVPTIESQDAAFNTLGMDWRAFEDFGVGMEAEQGAVQNDGE